MIFTTTKKKQEKLELFPDTAVLTQFPYNKDVKGSKTVFKLNSKAMNDFGFPVNTPNASKIANGFDEENRVVLAAVDTNDIYTSNITAKNTFSSQKLMERIAGELNLDMSNQHHFALSVAEYDGIKASYLTLMDTTAVEEEVMEDEVVESVQEELAEMTEEFIPQVGEVPPADVFLPTIGEVGSDYNTLRDVVTDVPKVDPFRRVDTNSLF